MFIMSSSVILVMNEILRSLGRILRNEHRCPKLPFSSFRTNVTFSESLSHHCGIYNWPIISTHLFNFTVAFITSWDYFAYLFPCLSLGSLHENRYHDPLSPLVPPILSTGPCKQEMFILPKCWCCCLSNLSSKCEMQDLKYLSVLAEIMLSFYAY